MNQRSYSKKVLKRFNMKDCKPVGNPFDANSKLLNLVNEEFRNLQREIESVPYKAGVGSLIYAMVDMRADLAFAVSTVSQFISKVGPLHWMAVKRIMRYVKGILDFKLCIRGNDMALGGFCDADWTGDAND